MGGSSSTTTSKQKQKSKNKSKSVASPFKPTVAPLTNTINAAGAIPGANNTTPTPVQDSAIQGLLGNAQLGIDQYNPQQQQLISDLYGGMGAGQGLQNNLNAQSSLQQYFQPGFLDPGTNPYLAPAMQAAQQSTYDDTAKKFALAGRDFSGDFSTALGSGYASALAPMMMGQYNTGVNQQLAAAGQTANLSNSIDNSAKTQASIRTGAAGQQAALNNPYLAQLAAAQTQAALPYTNISQQAQFLTPLAGLGGTTNTKSKGTTVGTGTSTTFQQTDPLQMAIGGLVGGAGLLGGMGAFGKGGWMNFGSTAVA